MKDRSGDTSMGGSQAAFPDTSWGLIARIGDSSEPTRRAGLESLCCRYWKPVYRYLRTAWSRSNEDAKDLTQVFFLWLLEEDALGKYSGERGSFRRFLKVVLGRFVSHRDEEQRRLKRGGGRSIRSLEAREGAIAQALPDPGAEEPEEAFDREWMSTVTRLAIERVRARLVRGGRAIQMRVYEEYELATTRPTYAELAARVGIKETDVTNHLHAVRKAIREEVKRELGRTTSGDAAREAEERELLEGEP